MSKDKSILLEQYFTKPQVARDSIQVIFEDLKNSFNLNVFQNPKIHFIEPSCGEGIFIQQLQKTNSSVRITGLDIDNLYPKAMVGDFLKTDKQKLTISKDEITVFFGCPPSFLTREFLQHCQIVYPGSKVYFLLAENKLKTCIDAQLIVFKSISILKNYEYNAFLFKNTDCTTQGAYLLTRMIF